MQYNFCFFPLHGDGVTVSETNSAAEQMMWTVPITTPKPGVFEGKIHPKEEEPYKSVLQRHLNELLKPLGKEVIEPNEKEFISKTVQAYRKGEKAVHVKAFRGSKDGTSIFSVAAYKPDPLILRVFDSKYPAIVLSFSAN